MGASSHMSCDLIGKLAPMGRSYGQVRGFPMVPMVGTWDRRAMAKMIPYGSGHAALRRARVSLPQQVYHVTVTTKGRDPVFLDFEAACAAARCLHDADCLKGVSMLAWVLMPDHAHWLLQLDDQGTLPATVSRLKCASARSANRVLGRQGALWSRAFHDHAVRSDEQLRAIARYVVANPVRAGLVTKLGDYPFWNAIWL